MIFFDSVNEKNNIKIKFSPSYRRGGEIIYNKILVCFNYYAILYSAVTVAAPAVVGAVVKEN